MKIADLTIILTTEEGTKKVDMCLFDLLPDDVAILEMSLKLIETALLHQKMREAYLDLPENI